MPAKLKYADGREQEDLGLGAVLAFEVVNKSYPTKTMEDLVPMVITHVPERFNPAYDLNGPPHTLHTEHIDIPFGHKLMYNTPSNGVHPAIAVYNEPDVTIANVVEGQTWAKDCHDNGYSLAYSKSLALILKGESHCTLSADGNQHTFVCNDPATNGSNLDPRTHLALLPSQSELARVNMGVTNFIVTPLRYDKQFDLSYTDDLCLYDVYVLAAGQSVDTKVFPDSISSLLHTVKGSVTIGQYTVPYQKFYEYNANESVQLTATEDSIVVLITRVPSVIV